MGTGKTNTDKILAPEFRSVYYKIENNIAWVELNHEPSNIIDFIFIAELSWVLDQTAACPILVLTSNRSDFSTGVDIKIHTPALAPEMLHTFHTVIRKLYHFSGITICALNGHALGGGFELALCCDLIYAEKQTKIGLPEIRLACYPPVASVLLPRIVGRAGNAMLLTGDSISTDQALQIGLIDAVFEQDQKQEFLDSLMNRMNSYSYDALRVLKYVIKDKYDFNFDHALERAEKLYLYELLQSPDVAEGINAFLQKRPPQYRNHGEG